MEADRARELLRADRVRTQALLDETRARGASDRRAANEPGDMFDPAEALVDQGLDDSVAAALEQHLRAIDRAEQRLETGAYGRSVRSGAVIPDDRLEADPTAELTVDEASTDGTPVI
jgi:DnaK suppressor protein